MGTIYLIIGIIILGFTLLDLIWTTLWLDKGAGPISGNLTAVLWRFLRRMSQQNSKILRLAGPAILVLTLLTWVLLMWTGWTLIFSADPGSVTNTLNGGEVMWYERFYFVGYTMFTLGTGNYAPQEGVWQIVSTFISGGGMLFLTLGASYVISVVDAVVKKRGFATTITGLSKEPSNIIIQAWNGEDFNRLDLLLVNLSSELSLLSQQHNAYPMLHFYHSSKTEESAAVAIAILDEALTMMKFGVKEEVHPNPVLQKNIRESISMYLETLTFEKISSIDKTPPPPNLDTLRETGIPVVSDEEFERRISSIEEHRTRLLGAIEANGRDWPLDT